MKDDVSFASEEKNQEKQIVCGLKEDEKKFCSLKDEDLAHMQIVKVMHGPIPDSFVEPSLIKKYP